MLLIKIANFLETKKLPWVILIGTPIHTTENLVAAIDCSDSLANFVQCFHLSAPMVLVLSLLQLLTRLILG